MKSSNAGGEVLIEDLSFRQVLKGSYTGVVLAEALNEYAARHRVRYNTAGLPAEAYLVSMDREAVAAELLDSVDRVRGTKYSATGVSMKRKYILTKTRAEWLAERNRLMAGLERAITALRRFQLYATNCRRVDDAEYLLNVCQHLRLVMAGSLQTRKDEV
jgi:hypothetical protein